MTLLLGDPCLGAGAMTGFDHVWALAAGLPDGDLIDGFERIVDAFLGMLRGENTGKIIVRDRTEAPSVS